ncbi:ABC transporter substrate-binding protein [Halopseudomonas maritima]|uniref:ABC transporter substrate-binding protein n=1 Tax=Halopseudomonas maritima TaxID=2918528 RepID=UPI001EEBF171|nr:ABC transporter substrate-binding protein [Halopseudomonas maritima]UJJ31341.1 ABC transporter substrate-binding protein [Halopseudomonas maritima]
MNALRVALITLLLALCLPVQAAQTLVVLPGHSGLTDAFIAELQTALGRSVEVATSDDSDLPAQPSYRQIITMGQKALNWRLRQSAQIRTFATYLTGEYWHPRSQDAPPWLHVLYANPKPARQLQLSRTLMPRLDRAGMLLTPATAWQRTGWLRAAERLNIELIVAELDKPDELSRQLLGLIGQSDLLIGTDDSNIYNADNLKTILLTSYSRNKVLIGPSAPFIDAGSLSTTYSSPEDMARSVAYLIEQGAPPNAASYPRYFSVLSNTQVARSLGIPLPDDATLARRLAELEQEP